MTEIQFLFRFRDLVAKTIDEHQEIIDRAGSCWWGWWKRPSEDQREDVWEKLALASTENPIEVGLFDSGSGTVFRAKVTQVISPSSEKPISVPADEQDLVPPYYRNSPFSRAWMRLTTIVQEPEVFGRYSFAKVPKLPGYSDATLRRLEGKKIMSPDELRLMDTTIWEVREAKDSDPDEEILLSIPALASAVSSNVINCGSNVILHLTDLHFALGTHRKQHVWRLESEQDNRPSLVEAVTAALHQRKVGLVVASGDFTFLGSEEEFNEAAASLSLLLGILDLSTDHLIVIPGNHDIQWSVSEQYDNGAEVTRAPSQARLNYENFYRRLMRHDPDKHLSMGRRFALPCGLITEVTALNSSSLATGKDFLAGMGRIEEASFAEVANALGWKDEKTLALRLLVIHHHLSLLEDLEDHAGYGSGFGIAVDAPRVQRLAAKRGVHLALHGHKHRAYVTHTGVYELPEVQPAKGLLGELAVVGGGSAGSKETFGPANYFNVMELGSAALRLEIFQSRNFGAFEVMRTYVADLQAEEGRLTLAHWR